MRAAILSPLAAVVICLGTADVASAQIGSYWVYKGGLFIPENGGWAEYQKGKKAFTFTEVSRGPGAVELFDGSRGIRVRISGQRAEVSANGGPAGLVLSGNWHWTEWSGRNAKRVLIRFVDRGDGTWAEYHGPNSTTPLFTFKCVGRWKNDHVRLYDNTRGIYVDLYAGQASVSDGGKPGLVYGGRFTK